jgi:exopolyphosphatase/guanosine-5'-triphosphate,3'-diphosphate pyrophosphatase
VTRVAAVDIGTNSTRLLVADVDHEEIHDVVRRTRVTRLGEGVDAGRRLLPAAMERTLVAVADYAREIEQHRIEKHRPVPTLVVATSAARDAENGSAFLHDVGSTFGFATRLLSGAEEAELIRRGVGATAPGTLIVDVGGGSTELILAETRMSIDVGSVRLTERFLRRDPPAAVELDEAAAFVRALLPELEVTAAIGVAGTVAQLHVLAGELTREAVEGELARLAAMRAAERAQLPGMDPARAPVIVGGALVVREVVRRYRLPQLACCERDLLDGVALAAAASV